MTNFSTITAHAPTRRHDVEPARASRTARAPSLRHSADRRVQDSTAASVSRPEDPAPVRTASTVWLRLLAVVVAALYAVSIIGLSLTVPADRNLGSLPRDALVFGMLGMYSAVAALALAFTAAVRADSPPRPSRTRRTETEL